MAGNLRQISGPNSQENQGRRNRGGLLDDFFFALDPLRSMLPPSASSSALNTEIIRTNDGYTVELPVPGFSSEQVEVTVQENMVMISGRSQRRTFTRTLMLPEEIDCDNIEASVDHGMLSLQLRRRPEHEPRRIPVKSNKGSSKDEPPERQEDARTPDTIRGGRFSDPHETLAKETQNQGVEEANL